METGEFRDSVSLRLFLTLMLARLVIYGFFTLDRTVGIVPPCFPDQELMKRCRVMYIQSSTLAGMHKEQNTKSKYRS